jgi:hypothetical protein
MRRPARCSGSSKRQLARRQRLDPAARRSLAKPAADSPADPASWLKQIELYFRLLQHKTLTPNDFGSLDALADRLSRSGEYYREIA